MPLVMLAAGSSHVLPDGPLLAWLERPSDTRGVRFACGADGWQEWSWRELAAGARDVAAMLRDRFAGRGERVAIVMPNSPEFFAAFYGTLLAGHTPCPLSPPKIIDDRDRYQGYISSLAAVARPLALLTMGECTDMLGGTALSCPVMEVTAARAAAAFEPVELSELALLQFTSGSSGRPRAVQVTRANLEANLRAILDWAAIDPVGDAVATWLPTHHDMGLIGCTLAPAATGVSVSMMRPEDFVVRPLRWLALLGDRNESATMTATPPFGLGLALKRIAPEDLEDLDFARWRLAIMGAERIDSGLLARFIARFRDHNLDPALFAPAYGLAEGTLVVTGCRDGRTAPVVRPHWPSIARGSRVEITEQATIADSEILGSGTGWLVGCGTAPDGISVTVVDEDRQPVVEGVLGELVVGGACVADGYLGDPDAVANRFRDGTLASGDAGFIYDGQLYVIGRMANAVKVHGRWLFLEDVEVALHASGLVERSRCVVFAGAGEGGDEIVILVERDAGGDWIDGLAEHAEREVPEALGLRILAGEHGSIERTSSGKPRRGVLWAAHLEGVLPATTVHARARQRTGERTMQRTSG